MKLAERDLFAAEFGVLIIECWLLAYAHDICPSRASGRVGKRRLVFGFSMENWQEG